MNSKTGPVHTTVDSPIGPLLLTGEQTPDGVVLDSVTIGAELVHSGPVDGFAEIERQLRAYFAGRIDRFDIRHTGRGTPFQRRVWAAVDAIPYGTTMTYGQVADRVGAPRERVRAVAAAIGANPLLVVRPCHRVIGANGSLTGYAGGVARKHDLLVHEGALLS